MNTITPNSVYKLNFLVSKCEVSPKLILLPYQNIYLESFGGESFDMKYIQYFSLVVAREYIVMY